MEDINSIQRVYIRFNTEYPAKGKRWRLLNEEFDEFMQVQEFVGFSCPTLSSTDTLPTGQVKHHVMISFGRMVVNDEVAEFYP